MMGAMVELLRDRLTKLSPAERAEFVGRFPHAYAAPRPRTLHQLAVRLLAVLRVDAAALTRGEVQLLEAAVALSGQPSGRYGPAVVVRGALESMLGVGSRVSAARIEEVLGRLAARALVLADDDLGVLRIHPAALDLFRAPLGLRSHGAADALPPRHAPLEPGRPAPGLRSAHEGAAAGQAAAATALARLDRLLEAFTEGWPVLKRGGIAVAEVRRLGRLLHVPEDEARLWLHLAAELDLIAASHGRWTTTQTATAWARAEPAARLADLGRALLTLPALPLEVRRRRRAR
ncbi:hypothetical protein [Streptomyces mobaraensis]|uniref:Uncharacterized protein n=1 Tax=Streptomyces mobaraensis TaxID=35621 RepID=A0A5N5W1I4_STRMB|nr:hypothetical protein [Streptomyces mobaraensis]KAB7835748.1 hypothetical protein FRZ00_26375 [Streptomyces mobaraensis]